MDKKTETTNAEKVKKQLADLLKPYGFIRTKPTFYTRVLNDRIEFVHVHKFTFGSVFRVHIGIRFLCDTFEAVALNGPDSDSYRHNKDFDLSYYNENETIIKCANNMLDFIIKVGFEWLERWKDAYMLFNNQASPLKIETKDLYKNSLNGDFDYFAYKNSYKLLGIKLNNDISTSKN
jgi:hypothetical protein